tara:strand:+ start:175 stop:2232 length:2058 start_codon:yes stop_codon:yes gene_type:complete
MSYFMGKEGFVWWQGVVEDRHDPLYLGRCRVRVLGWNTEEKVHQPTSTLPWAYPVQPITSAAQTGVGTTPLGPVEGTWVLGFYRDGESAQEPMFFGTFGGIPEKDAKGENLQKGFFDPRLPDGDVDLGGHPDFPDEMGPRQLNYNHTANFAGQSVPREPATIVHNSAPDPTEHPQDLKISESVLLKQGAKATTHEAHVKGEYSNFPVSQLIKAGTASSPAFTVKLVENPIRSTFPDTGLSPLDKDIPESLISTTRNLNYLKEPTTNRLARGMRGNTLYTDPFLSGIVYEKVLNRGQGQVNIACASGRTWNEPWPPWAALYPYNHVHQTESGHIIEMDDTPGHERLHWYHRTGTFTEIHQVGIKVDKIVNDYYNIILGGRYTHIELGDCETIDGKQEVFVKGNKHDKIGSSYLIAMGGGSFSLENPGNDVIVNSGNTKVHASNKIDFTSTHFYRHAKHSHNTTVGEQTDKVGGTWTMRTTGAISLNTTGSFSNQAGASYSVNATDSIFQTAQGLLPAATFDYSYKTTSLLGRMGIESIDAALSGGIELLLGPDGLASEISMLPPGDIVIKSTTGPDGIAGSALLGDVSWETLAGSIKEASLLSSFELTPSGAAKTQGLLGEVSISSSGKIKVQGLIITLKEFMDEIIDIITEHTHPSGSGPTGPPMPPASVKLNLLKSLKVGQSFE